MVSATAEGLPAAGAARLLQRPLRPTFGRRPGVGTSAIAVAVALLRKVRYPRANSRLQATGVGFKAPQSPWERRIRDSPVRADGAPLLDDVSPRDMIRLGRYERLRKFIIHAMTERVANQRAATSPRARRAEA